MATNMQEIIADWVRKTESDNTKTRYERVLTDFVNMTFGVELYDLTEEHLASLRPSVVRDRYMRVMQEKGNKSSTIKSNARVISSFIGSIEESRLYKDTVDTSYIKMVCLDTKWLTDDTNSHSRLGSHDYYDFKRWLLEERFVGRHERLGYRYSLVAETFFKTASRADAIFKKLTWESFEWTSDSYGNEGWVARYIDKGKKKSEKVITESLYNKLYAEFYSEDTVDTDPVFKDLSNQFFGRLVKEYGETQNKSFTIHSFRVGAATEYYNITKDIYATREFLDHSNIETTIGYIKGTEDRTTKGGYILSLEVDEDKLELLSQEQLISIIKSNKQLSINVAQEAERRRYVDKVMCAR